MVNIIGRNSVPVIMINCVIQLDWDSAGKIIFSSFTWKVLVFGWVGFVVVVCFFHCSIATPSLIIWEFLIMHPVHTHLSVHLGHFSSLWHPSQRKKRKRRRRRKEEEEEEGEEEEEEESRSSSNGHCHINVYGHECLWSTLSRGSANHTDHQSWILMFISFPSSHAFKSYSVCTHAQHRYT